MPFQGLILIGQVVPKLWPFIYQPMKGHVAAYAWLRRPVCSRPTMTSRAGYDGDRCLSYRGVRVAMVNGSECHGKQRQGGKLDFNFDYN